MTAAHAVLVPLKSSDRAKSRLDLAERRQVALAMAADTLAAVAGTPEVRMTVLLVENAVDAFVVAGGDLDGVDVMLTAAPGLNEALVEGARFLIGRGWSGPVAVLPADLPFLTPDDLGCALREAAGRRAVVADSAGTGTTLLVAPTGADLAPAFGVDSFAAHQRLGAIALMVDGSSSLRRDVDRVGDLQPRGGDARLGPATERVLRGIDDARLLQVTVLP